VTAPIHISVVSPVYRAANLVDRLVDRIHGVVSQLTSSYEIVLVDDRSPDGSWEKILENCARLPCVRGIRLSRNFGQEYAINAGLDSARGEWVVVLDCDLQDPPEEISRLYAKAQEGFEIVLASRHQRKDHVMKRAASRAFHALLGYLTDTRQDSSIAHFMLLNRKVVEALADMKDYHRYYPMLVQWVGFKVAVVEIQHAQRDDGRSSYTLRKRFNLALTTVLAFSDKPLRLLIQLGLWLAIAAALVAVIGVVEYFRGGISVRGWPSLVIAISFFSGLIIAVLGVIGLYLGKVFESVKGRPTYIVAERSGR
jgi:dolichol-phosphate mannosyltransferase